MQLDTLNFENDDDIISIDGENESFIMNASNKTIHNDQTSRKTLHVINGILLKDKKESGIISEWEVNLKSALSNAPTDNDMHIHVLTNKNAAEVIKDKIERINFSQSKWKNRVSLTVYNVESKTEKWMQFLKEHLKGAKLDQRVSLGGYYRLFAYQVLKDRGVDEALYMDTDVVILANLNDLMRYMNTTHEQNESIIWQFAETSANSGFMILNMNKFHKFWELVAQLPKIDSGGDQKLLNLVVENSPNVTVSGVLPDEWNTHLGHGWRPHPHKLLDAVERDERKAGMLHFTGAFGETYFSGTTGLDKYCERTSRCKNYVAALYKYRSTWGLAEYYVRLPWKLLMYFESSKIPSDQEGFPFQFEIINC